MPVARTKLTFPKNRSKPVHISKENKLSPQAKLTFPHELARVTDTILAPVHVSNTRPMNSAIENMHVANTKLTFPKNRSKPIHISDENKLSPLAKLTFPYELARAKNTIHAPVHVSNTRPMNSAIENMLVAYTKLTFPKNRSKLVDISKKNKLSPWEKLTFPNSRTKTDRKTNRQTNRQTTRQRQNSK